MTRTAKLFTTDGGQAVRLPVEFRFESNEVHIWKGPRTGNDSLSANPAHGWEEFVAMREELGAAATEFLVGRGQKTEMRNPFVNWTE